MARVGFEGPIRLEFDKITISLENARTAPYTPNLKKNEITKFIYSKFVYLSIYVTDSMCKMNRTSIVPKSVLRYELDKGQYIAFPLPNLVSQV